MSDRDESEKTSAHRCSKCNRTEDQLAEAGVDCDFSVFTECEACDPGGASGAPL